MTSWGCTPTCRGFDHFYGFYVRSLSSHTSLLSHAGAKPAWRLIDVVLLHVVLGALRTRSMTTLRTTSGQALTSATTFCLSKTRLATISQRSSRRTQSHGWRVLSPRMQPARHLPT